MTSNGDGGGPSRNSGGANNDPSKATEAMKKLNMKEMLDGLASSGDSEEPKPDMSKHKFWQTQPVPSFPNSNTPTTSAPTTGPIDPTTDTNLVPKTPYPLVPGFDWVTLDLTTPAHLTDLYTLLNANYVEDTEAMFRFNYSVPFLNWALKSPGWRPDWHVGIRASASGKLVAFISGVPCTLKVREQRIICSEINFLCVHKKLRSKRLAPVLIKEITRRCNLVGIWQAIYTAGVMLPTPVSTCRYYHRALDWPKLYEAGFSPLPPGSTKQRQVLRYKLPEKTGTKGLRLMEGRDVEEVTRLLRAYLGGMEVAQEFTEEEVRHWFLGPEPGAGGGKSPEGRVVHTYVVEDASSSDGGAPKLTDFFSYYCIESTVIGNEKVKSIRVAYLFYYATEAAFSKDNKLLKARLNELMADALILAKKDDFDVFNALTLLDNPLFLQDQKFGAGDGRLHYYLYNFRTPSIPGGINTAQDIDVSKMGGVGVVML